MQEKCLLFETNSITKQNLKNKIMVKFNIFEKKEDEQKTIYTLYSLNKKGIKKIERKIKTINVPIILSKEIKENAKKEEYKNTKIYKIIKSLKEDKTIFRKYIEEVLNNVVTRTKEFPEQQSLYILAKSENVKIKNEIISMLSRYKAVNIVTTNLREFQKLEENLDKNLETFTVLNNKRKSLARAQYIINIDFSEEELLEYNINRTANIFNLNTEKLHLNNFDGYIINNIEINSNNQKYDIKDLYLANMINEEDMKNIIKSGQYKLIGNNGYIF